MTRTSNARLAGSAFLVYIAAGITSMVLFGRASAGGTVAERLAAIDQNRAFVGVVELLGLVQCLSALVLGVTLWAITRDEDADLSMLGMLCRVGEGLVGVTSIPETQRLLWLAATRGDGSLDAGATNALGAYMLKGDSSLTATLFAVGSTLFCYLLLRGRMIPTVLAWIGVVASVLLVVVLPLQLAGFLHGAVTMYVWLPMLAFEVPFAVWLLTKGVKG